MLKAVERLGADRVDTSEELATIVGPLPEIAGGEVKRYRIPIWVIAGVITVVLLMVFGALVVFMNPPQPTHQTETAAVIALLSVTPKPVQAISPTWQPPDSPRASGTATNTAVPTLKATDTPIPIRPPVERMIESFESYSSNRALRAAYSTNAPENDAFVSLAKGPDVYRGSQALAFTYHIHTIVPAGGYTVTDYAGFVRNLPAQDWRGFSYLRLWVRSDGSNKDLVVQFQGASGEVWKYRTNLSDFRDADWKLALHKGVFHLAEWASPVDNEMDLDSIVRFSISVGHGGTGQATSM